MGDEDEEQDDDISMEQKEKKRKKRKIMMIRRKKPEIINNDDLYQYDDEGLFEEDEEEENVEDDDLRKEMEANWEKEEGEKNEGMLDLLQRIKNKKNNKQSPTKQRPKKISPNLQQIKNKNIPKLKPFAFGGDLKISFPANTKHKTQKIKKKDIIIKKHHHSENPEIKRKKMKNALKRQLSKKRKSEMRKYRKQHGTEQDHYRHLEKYKKIKDEIH